MNIVTKYLDQLKNLYKTTHLYETSFIEFVDELNVIYPNIEKEIKDNYIKLSPSEFNRFVKQEITEIKKLGIRLEEKDRSKIEHWFNHYDSRYFTINSILKYDTESTLYSYLSYEINNAPDHQLANHIFELQEDFLLFTKEFIGNEIINYLTDMNESTQKDIKKAKYKDYAWFKVGMLFATGEINSLKEEFTTSIEIARNKFHINPNKYRPYISDSFGDNPKGTKNIFNDKSKLLKIQSHCTENNIKMSVSFKDKIHSIQSN